MTRAARRMEGDVFYMASALAAYRAIEGLDDESLAARLSCDVDDLPSLALCRRPDPTSPRFQAEVQRIADYAGVQPLALVRLLRAVNTGNALRGQRTSLPDNRGLLAAARDHEEPEPQADSDDRMEPEHD
jgi:hypothetical protein